jgi:hypothetical protein
MMAHDTSHEHAHGNKAKGKLTERRFVAEPTARTNIQSLVGGLGAALLGAGAYGAWVHDAPMVLTPYLFGAGAVAILGGWAMTSGDSSPLRVGDAGIAAERGEAQPDRLPWWLIEKVSFDPGAGVVAEGGGRRIVAALDYHPAAAGFIVKEALERIPRRVAIDGERSAAIVKGADEHAGTVLTIEPVQVAGRRCKASNVILSFERDATLCPRCGEVYDRRHVPAACLTCEAPMPSA